MTEQNHSLTWIHLTGHSKILPMTKLRLVYFTWQVCAWIMQYTMYIHPKRYNWNENISTKYKTKRFCIRNVCIITMTQTVWKQEFRNVKLVDFKDEKTSGMSQFVSESRDSGSSRAGMTSPAGHCAGISARSSGLVATPASNNAILFIAKSARAWPDFCQIINTANKHFHL